MNTPADPQKLKQGLFILVDRDNNVGTKTDIDWREKALIKSDKIFYYWQNARNILSMTFPPSAPRTQEQIEQDISTKRYRASGIIWTDEVPEEWSPEWPPPRRKRRWLIERF